MLELRRNRINKKEIPMTGLVASKKEYWMLLPARNVAKVTVIKALSIKFQQS